MKQRNMPPPTPEDATKAMSDALSALPADRRGDTYTAPAAGG